MSKTTILTLGELIRRRRREAGLTQSQLANQIGVQSSYIAKIENGTQRGSYEKLAKISLALHLPWNDMMMTGHIEIPALYQDDSVYPVLDIVFREFHPLVKEELIEIGRILEKYLE